MQDLKNNTASAYSVKLAFVISHDNGGPNLIRLPQATTHDSELAKHFLKQSMGFKDSSILTITDQNSG